jgi:hypothetical protein
MNGLNIGKKVLKIDVRHTVEEFTKAYQSCLKANCKSLIPEAKSF